MVRPATFFFILFFQLIATSFLCAQNATISGKITDKSDKSDLIGVTIAVKGTRYGAVTDEDGKYNISLPTGTFNLEVTYIGYENLLYTGIILKDGETKTLNISMNP